MHTGGIDILCGWMRSITTVRSFDGNTHCRHFHLDTLPMAPPIPRYLNISKVRTYVESLCMDKNLSESFCASSFSNSGLGIRTLPNDRDVATLIRNWTVIHGRVTLSFLPIQSEKCEFQEGCLFYG